MPTAKPAQHGGAERMVPMPMAERYARCKFANMQISFGWLGLAG